MYDFEVTTPANTARSDPTRTDMQLHKGVIDLVQIAFPPGPQGHLHVLIERGDSVVWPRNEGAGFVADRETITFAPFYELDDEPLTLEAVTWSDDDTFPHTIHIRLNVVPREIAFPSRPELPLITKMAGLLFGRRQRPGPASPDPTIPSPSMGEG